MTTLTIAQLYPELLGVTGDRGNVTVLHRRLEAASITPRTVMVQPGEALPDDVDIVVIGNGPLSAMRQVGDDLTTKAAALRAHTERGGALLAVGGGAELLSHGVVTLDDERVPGIGLFPFLVRRTRERRVGYIIAEADHGQLVGFEDHASTWELDPGVTPYGQVSAGKGSIGTPGIGGGESVRIDAAYATNVQGPVLPLNPQLADAILHAACERRGIEYRTADAMAAADALAEGARSDIRRLVKAKAPTVMGI